MVSLAAIVPALDRLLPTGLSAPAIQVAAGTVGELDPGHLLSAVAGTVVLIGISLAGALLAFRRREL